MSVEQARALVKRASEDPDFVRRLDDADTGDKRRVLIDEGYGDVKLQHLSKALPESNGGELSDEEFAEVAGATGPSTSMATSMISVITSTSAAVAAAT